MQEDNFGRLYFEKRRSGSGIFYTSKLNTNPLKQGLNLHEKFRF